MVFYNEDELYSFYLSSSEDDEDYVIDYKYNSTFIDTTDFMKKPLTKPEEIDEIDELLKLYEPRDRKYNIKTKNSVWKKFIFLFSRNNRKK